MTINELHAAVGSGVPGARERLYARLSESFEIFVQQKIRDRQDAEEVVQDALLAITTGLETVELTVSFGAWAYGVLQNKLRHYYRTARYQRQRYAAGRDGGEISNAVTVELRTKLLECLKRLHAVNPRHARALSLSYQGYKADEMSSRMKVSRNGIYIILSRARSLLKQCLSGKDSTL